MQFFQTTRRRIILSFCTTLLVFAECGVCRSAATSQLATIQTADTIGKHGHTTTFGLFQLQKGRIKAKDQSVDIGNFTETHQVELEIETFLIPIRFIFGIGDDLDLSLGATFTTGGVRKIISDYYKTGDVTRNQRVYNQALFDTTVGLKYGIKPDDRNGLPKIAVGGDVQIGFSADNQLNSMGDFLDHSPANSFPFVGVNTYFVGTHKISNLVKGHAGVGTYLSSKSLKINDSFLFYWQLGGEALLTDELWIIADFSRKFPLAGMTLSDQISIGMRYELSNGATFHFGYISEPGFQFSISVNGEKDGVIVPRVQHADDLVF